VPTLLALLLAPLALRIFFGPGFVPGANAVRILAIGMFAMAPAGLFASYYTLKLGRPMVSFWNSVLAGSICAVLSIILVPRLGMDGAALASTVAYVVGSGVMFRLFLRDSGLPLASVVLMQPEDVARLQSAARNAVNRVRARAA
jgi:O-antigen/teichoic acid export membrane protein